MNAALNVAHEKLTELVVKRTHAGTYPVIFIIRAILVAIFAFMLMGTLTVLLFLYQPPPPITRYSQIELTAEDDDKEALAHCDSINDTTEYGSRGQFVFTAPGIGDVYIRTRFTSAQLFETLMMMECVAASAHSSFTSVYGYTTRSGTLKTACMVPHATLETAAAYLLSERSDLETICLTSMTQEAHKANELMKLPEANNPPTYVGAQCAVLPSDPFPLVSRKSFYLWPLVPYSPWIRSQIIIDCRSLPNPSAESYYNMDVLRRDRVLCMQGTSTNCTQAALLYAGGDGRERIVLFLPHATECFFSYIMNGLPIPVDCNDSKPFIDGDVSIPRTIMRFNQLPHSYPAGSLDGDLTMCPGEKYPLKFQFDEQMGEGVLNDGVTPALETYKTTKFSYVCAQLAEPDFLSRLAYIYPLLSAGYTILLVYFVKLFYKLVAAIGNQDAKISNPVSDASSEKARPLELSAPMERDHLAPNNGLDTILTLERNHHAQSSIRLDAFCQDVGISANELFQMAGMQLTPSELEWWRYRRKSDG